MNPLRSGKEGHSQATIEDLFAFATLRADEETRERVIAAMNDRTHPLSHLIRSEVDVLAAESPASDSARLNESNAQGTSVPGMLEPFRWECPQAWIEEGRKATRNDFERILYGRVPLKIIVRAKGALCTPHHPIVEELRLEKFPLNEVRKRLFLK